MSGTLSSPGAFPDGIYLVHSIIFRKIIPGNIAYCLLFPANEQLPGLGITYPLYGPTCQVASFLGFVSLPTAYLSLFYKKSPRDQHLPVFRVFPNIPFCFFQSRASAIYSKYSAPVWSESSLYRLFFSTLCFWLHLLRSSSIPFVHQYVPFFPPIYFRHLPLGML